MDDQERNSRPEREHKVAHFLSFLFTSAIALLISVFVKKLFKKWCREFNLTPKEGLLVLIVFVWMVGIALIIVAYLVFLFSQLMKT